jgi:hypothetical protein
VEKTLEHNVMDLHEMLLIAISLCGKVMLLLFELNSDEIESIIFESNDWDSFSLKNSCLQI